MKKRKQLNVAMPVYTDMELLKERLKKVKESKGKTANALIVAYILKLAK